MSGRPARFRQCEIERALRAIERVDQPFELIIQPDGSMRLVKGTDQPRKHDDLDDGQGINL